MVKFHIFILKNRTDEDDLYHCIFFSRSKKTVLETLEKAGVFAKYNRYKYHTISIIDFIRYVLLPFNKHKGI